MSHQTRAMLYVGPPKTGTTSVQNFAWANRDALMKQGIYIPLAGARKGRQHILLAALMAKEWRASRKARLDFQASAEEGPSKGRWARQRRRREAFQDDLEGELADAPSWHTLLFLSEAIFPACVTEIRSYRELLAPFVARLDSLMYLRRQDQWLASRTMQNRKVGSRRGLDLDAGMPKRFAATVRAWHLESDRCHIRRFEPARWVQGSLLHDFCDAVGAETTGLNLVEIRKNPALFQEQLELVDAINVRLADMAFADGMASRSQMLAVTADNLGGTKIGVSKATAKATFEAFADINIWLRDNFDPDGPDYFFNADFTAYEEYPRNDACYSTDQLLHMVWVITKQHRRLGLAPPRAPDAHTRQDLIDFIVSAYLPLRDA